jgi:hypothetical protein
MSIRVGVRSALKACRYSIAKQYREYLVIACVTLGFVESFTRISYGEIHEEYQVAH